VLSHEVLAQREESMGIGWLDWNRGTHTGHPLSKHKAPAQEKYLLYLRRRVVQVMVSSEFQNSAKLLTFPFSPRGELSIFQPCSSSSPLLYVV